MPNIVTLNIPTISESSFGIEADKIPDVCPYCHRHIVPDLLTASQSEIKGFKKLQVIFQCLHPECQSIFIGYYNYGYDPNRYYFQKTSIGNSKPIAFSTVINDISPNFVKIYDQAADAEHLQLDQIAGIGFRKSFEFLIKDYLIKLDPERSDEIKRMRLGNCITQLVENENLKITAERTIWIGNDETHYVKKWEGKDLRDMKLLIEISIRWIESDEYTRIYNDEMQS